MLLSKQKSREARVCPSRPPCRPLRARARARRDAPLRRPSPHLLLAVRQRLHRALGTLAGEALGTLARHGCSESNGGEGEGGGKRCGDLCCCFVRESGWARLFACMCLCVCCGWMVVRAGRGRALVYPLRAKRETSGFLAGRLERRPPRARKRSIRVRDARPMWLRVRPLRRTPCHAASLRARGTRGGRQHLRRSRRAPLTGRRGPHYCSPRPPSARADTAPTKNARPRKRAYL